MRFSLYQLLLLVTGVCVLFGWLATAPAILTWAVAAVVMCAAFLSGVSWGGSLTARWWRTTFIWLGLLLAVSVLFEWATSHMIVEMFWLTGIAAMFLGTCTTVLTGRR